MRRHAPRRKCLRVAVAGSVYASATKSKSSKSSITLRGDLDVMLRALSPRCVPAARARQDGSVARLKIGLQNFVYNVRRRRTNLCHHISGTEHLGFV